MAHCACCVHARVPVRALHAPWDVCMHMRCACCFSMAAWESHRWGPSNHAAAAWLLGPHHAPPAWLWLGPDSHSP